MSTKFTSSICFVYDGCFDEEISPYLSFHIDDSQYHIGSICIGNMFDKIDIEFIQNLASNMLLSGGILVIIVTKSWWVSTSRKNLAALESSELDTLLLICNDDSNAQIPLHYMIPEQRSNLFYVRTGSLWIGRFIKSLIWAYGRPLATITPNAKDWIAALLSLYSLRRKTYCVCTEEFDADQIKLMYEEAKLTAKSGQIEYIFIAVTSHGLTASELVSVEQCLRRAFSDTCKLGIHSVNDTHWSQKTMLIELSIFYNFSMAILQ